MYMNSTALSSRSVPAEGDVTRPVSSLLHERLVKLPSGTRVNGCPAVFTVVLKTSDISTEERSELAPTTRALTLITQLVIQYIWLHFHLGKVDTFSLAHVKAG